MHALLLTLILAGPTDPLPRDPWCVEQQQRVARAAISLYIDPSRPNRERQTEDFLATVVRPNGENWIELIGKRCRGSLVYVIPLYDRDLLWKEWAPLAKKSSGGATQTHEMLLGAQVERSSAFVRDVAKRPEALMKYWAEVEKLHGERGLLAVVYPFIRSGKQETRKLIAAHPMWGGGGVGWARHVAVVARRREAASRSQGARPIRARTARIRASQPHRLRVERRHRRPARRSRSS